MTINHTPTDTSIPNKGRPPASLVSRLLDIPPKRWDAIEKLTAELERIAAISKARAS